ncbi:hypothetical protein like AT4G14290 [Hibiscus trionum]|uniref:Uncharacterized protein n=1 Tax=Hibiscus trionum TaxID=183268 RepID=A0A9W7H2K0_HIBTR|nr:hypothetical protein like AT4G14290 [Hibiscus trionum]
MIKHGFLSSTFIYILANAFYIDALHLQGDKNIIKFEGDHNSPRPQFYFDSINIFFHNVLQPPEDEVGATFCDSVHDYFGKGSWAAPEVGFFPDSSAASKATSSTSDAIKQVRSKRPMSRTEVPSDIPSEENNPRCQNEDTVDGNGSSSSNMISFELSNGHPFDPHVPTTMDDDQYVEYQLDDLTGFPCNVEEEERMFMEAIIESLKDLDMRHPQTEEQPKTCAYSSESLRRDEINSRDACSPAENCSSVPLESTSTQVEHHQSSLVVNGSNVGLEQASPDTSVSALGLASETPPSTEESGSTSISTQTDTTQTSSDADMSGSTKATVTVVRNPSSNVMDGLMRRWDLNFFRNSR